MSHLDRLRYVAGLLQSDNPPDMVQAILFSCPILLEPDVRDELEGDLRPGRGVPADERPLLESTLAALGQAWSGIAAGGSWPFGMGPFETACRLCEQGEMTWENAARNLTGGFIAGFLSPRYVARVSIHYGNHAGRGQWKIMNRRLRLIRVAIRSWAGRPGPYGEANIQVELSWLSTAKITLCEVSDGRLYREANADAEALVSRAEASGEERFIEAANLNAGLLHLDPYSSGFSSENARAALRERQDRFRLESAHELMGVPEEEWRMPAPEHALGRAVAFLERARRCPAGVQRGLVLKALIQARQWRNLYDPSAPTDDVPALCREALAHLDEEDYPVQVAFVRTILQEFAADHEFPDFQTLFAERGSEHAMRGLSLRIKHVSKTDPSAAWELCRQHYDLVESSCAEEERQEFSRIQLGVLSDLAVARSLRPPIKPQERSLRAALKACRQRHRADPASHLLALISLTARAQETNTERELLEAVGKIGEDQLGWTEYANVLGVWTANLARAAGSFAWNNHELLPMIEFYGRAADAFLRLNMPRSALRVLDYLLDIRGYAGDRPEVIDALLLVLPKLCAPAECLIGDAATNLLQMCLQELVSRLPETELNRRALAIFQLSKGWRLAGALTRAPLDSYRRSSEHNALLERIVELRGERDSSGRSDLSKHNEDLLGSWLTPPTELPADSVAARYIFACRRFDELTFSQLLNQANAEPAVIGLASTRAKLTDHTALLVLYEGAAPSGKSTLYLHAITRRETVLKAISNREPAGLYDLHLPPDVGTAITTRLGLYVRETRCAVREEPPKDQPATESALALLEAGIPLLFGEVWPKLEEWRAQGINHLVVVPHGPLHFFPFHLLGPGNQPLGSRFTVSCLPNLQLLMLNGAASRRAPGCVAFGIGFDGEFPHGLPPLREAPGEARKIADIFGQSAVVNDDATEERFREALQHSRYVHLATHGAQHVYAPAFHTVYLTPSGTSDGILHAHELLGTDCRGLELVTLSACETALGRFDRADNLRGLPASLFLSGAQTLIGTLWPIHSDVSAWFFTNLYQRLHSGQGRLLAFSETQRETRERFPEHRDWGAFFYAGAWDTPRGSEDAPT